MVPHCTQWFCWSLSRHEKWLAISLGRSTQHFQTNPCEEIGKGPDWKTIQTVLVEKGDRWFWGWHSKEVSEPCDFSWKTNYNSATATSTWIAMRAVQVVSYLLSQGSDLHLRLEDFRILRGLQELEMSVHLFPILEPFETIHARASKSRPVSAIFLCNANSVKTSAAFRPGIEVRPSAVGVTCSKEIHQFHGQLCPLSKPRGSHLVVKWFWVVGLVHSSMGDIWFLLGTYQPYPSVSMGTYRDLPSGELTVCNGKWPSRNSGDFPIKNGGSFHSYGDFPIKHGDFPMKNGDFPIKNGDSH